MPLTIEGKILMYYKKEVYGLICGFQRLEKIIWAKVDGKVGGRSAGDGGLGNHR